MHINFFIVSQIAGQIVGLMSFLLISMVIRPHLKLLSHKMQDIADGLQNKKVDGYESKCEEDLGLCQIEVVSNDEIGVSAKAYNTMLEALIQAHKVESVFNQFSKVMSENLETDILSNETIKLLIDSTYIDGAAIFMLSSGELKLEGVQGIVDAEQLAKHPAVLRAMKEGKETYLKMPEHIELDGILTKFKPSEIFIEPIEFKSAQLGILIAATGAHFADEHTIQLLQLFTRSIGLALNNTTIHSKFQKLAAIDGLTNIYNRRFGMERLREDFSRAERENSLLSIAMVDIDHFKNVNDTYGHLVGDKAIIMVTSIIKKALREGDIVMRYGGEEFLIIMHGASCENAFNICERIRHMVLESAVHEDSQEIKLTISMGLVSFPTQTATNEVELIDKADQALYQAKQGGRNQVVPFVNLAKLEA
jgi:two-component system cell cycle response regulator